MGVKLAAASGGSIELVPTNTASAFTLTVPASTGTMATTESTLTQFNVSGSAPVYACRAWVNFNGTGTVAIRASGNVSSITDNGVGDYTVNFTTAMSDTDYATVVSGDAYNGYTSIGYGDVNTSWQNVAFTRIRTFVATATYDKPLYTLAVFR